MPIEFEYKKVKPGKRKENQELKYSTRALKTVALYNHFRIRNDSNKMTEAQTRELQSTYRPDSEPKIQEAALKRFIKNDEVRNFANDQLIKTLTDNDITIDYLVKEKKSVLQQAKEKDQLSVALKAIESFENNLGINNKVKVTESVRISQNNSLSDNFSKAIAEKKDIKVIEENKQPDEKNA